MRRIRVIPVLLIKDGGLVKSVQFKKHQYIGDPINAVRIFNEKEVDEIAILDISATSDKRGPKFDEIEEIANEAFMPLSYGGGIKTLQDIDRLLYNGVEKVILNHSALNNPRLITDAANKFGSQSVVVSIDVKKDWLKKYKVNGQSGNDKSNWDPVSFSKYVEELGAGEIFLNSIDKDGTYGGYDLNLIEVVAAAVEIPIIACGGASEMNDFKLAIQNGASAVSAGSMFVFQRPHQAVLLTYPNRLELQGLYSHSSSL